MPSYANIVWFRTNVYGKLTGKCIAIQQIRDRLWTVPSGEILRCGQLVEELGRMNDTANTSESVNTESTENTEENQQIFQAIGIIRGDVSVDEESKVFIQIDKNSYPLLFAPRCRKAYQALLLDVKNHGGKDKRLVVYPKFIHFPGRDKQYIVSFQLVGFDNGASPQDSAAVELGDFEFKLSGLWQFIPVCRTPCISVLRNYTEQRSQHLKDLEPDKKARFLKASHLPLLWKDAIAPPFRFNPKLDREQQGKPMFVSIKAKFLPHRNVFGFDSLLGVPTPDAPRFLKLRKERPPARKGKPKPRKSEAPTPKKEAPRKEVPKKEEPKINNSSTQVVEKQET